MRGKCVVMTLALLLSVGGRLQAESKAQGPITLIEDGSEADVVVLALGSDDESEEADILSLLEGTASPQKMSSIQLDIVSKTSGFGPVLVLVGDEEEKARFLQDCKKTNLCDGIANGRIRVEVVEHEGPWIRDFGPSFGTDAHGRIVAVDAKYADYRHERHRKRLLSDVNEQRMKLAVAKFENAGKTIAPEVLLEDDESLTQDNPDKKQTDAVNELLDGLDHIAAILSEPGFMERTVDDQASGEMAEVALRNPDFELVSAPMFLEGGNLLHLGKGRCVTTNDLFNKNREIDVDLHQVLAEQFGCTDVIVLRPLPGPVIKHADMFLLPAPNDTVLLASYDFGQSILKEQVPLMSKAAKQLMVEAAIAMDIDERLLQEHQVKVVRVMSPPPRATFEEGRMLRRELWGGLNLGENFEPAISGDIYFPTLLNALVRKNAASGYQIVLPTYADVPPTYESITRDAIKKAFGPSVDIVAVDSTEAARRQGAVHCLTLTVPLRFSVFGDQDEADKRQAYGKKLETIQQDVGNYDLNGSWALSMTKSGAEESALKSCDRLLVDDDDVICYHLGRKVFKGEIALKRESLKSWRMQIESLEESFTGRINWLDETQIVVSSANGDEFKGTFETQPVSLNAK